MRHKQHEQHKLVKLYETKTTISLELCGGTTINFHRFLGRELQQRE